MSGFYPNGTRILSVESQKGAINIQRCFIENQKGAIAVNVYGDSAPFWFSMEYLWIVIAPFWLSTDYMLIVSMLCLWCMGRKGRNHEKWCVVKDVIFTFHQKNLVSSSHCLGLQSSTQFSVLIMCPTERCDLVLLAGKLTVWMLCLFPAEGNER